MLALHTLLFCDSFTPLSHVKIVDLQIYVHLLFFSFGARWWRRLLVTEDFVFATVDIHVEKIAQLQRTNDLAQRLIDNRPSLFPLMPNHVVNRLLYRALQSLETYSCGLFILLSFCFEFEKIDAVEFISSCLLDFLDRDF